MKTATRSKIRRFEKKVAIEFEVDGKWTTAVYVPHEHLYLMADNLREAAKDITKKTFTESELVTRIIPPSGMVGTTSNTGHEDDL